MASPASTAPVTRGSQPLKAAADTNAPEGPGERCDFVVLPCQQRLHFVRLAKICFVFLLRLAFCDSLTPSAVLTSTSNAAARCVGKYLQMMRLLHPIAYEVFLGTTQVFEYYLYAVMVFFVPVDKCSTWRKSLSLSCIVTKVLLQLPLPN